jgi:ABC-type amino acid transport substrate-binding protein
MRNKRISLMLVASLTMGGATGYASPYDDIVEKGELSIAVYRDFPPFSSLQSGVLSGIDIDVATELAARLKLKPVFMEFTAGESMDDDLRNAVWKGHYIDHRTANVMMHVPTDRQFALRNPNAVIFAPYYHERILVARNPELINLRDGVEVFTHEKVGVEGASLSDFYLTSAMNGQLTSHVSHFTNLTKAAEALTAGDVAAVMGTETELSTALGLDQTQFVIAPMQTPGLAKPGWDLGLAVKDTNHQLADALDDVVNAMRRDGTLAAIFGHHGSSYTPPDN